MNLFYNFIDFLLIHNFCYYSYLSLINLLFFFYDHTYLLIIFMEIVLHNYYKIHLSGYYCYFYYYLIYFVLIFNILLLFIVNQFHQNHKAND